MSFGGEIVNAKKLPERAFQSVVVDDKFYRSTYNGFVFAGCVRAYIVRFAIEAKKITQSK